MSDAGISIIITQYRQVIINYTDSDYVFENVLGFILYVNLQYYSAVKLSWHPSEPNWGHVLGAAGDMFTYTVLLWDDRVSVKLTVGQTAAWLLRLQ